MQCPPPKKNPLKRDGAIKEECLNSVIQQTSLRERNHVYPLSIGLIRCDISEGPQN